MTLLTTPPGTKDVLPTEAAELRLIEDAVRTVFAEFGYGEVWTPTLEFEEVLALSGEKAFQTGFRMLDENGQVLILRPDLTAPIARLVGSRLRGGVPPHRVFSISTIFRRLSSHRDRETEYRQAGIELLGSSLPHADAEVVAVACRALERAGLRGYRVGVGQISFFAGLLRALGLDLELQRRLTQDVVAKDLVNYRLIVEGADSLLAADRRLLLEVPDLRGGPDVLDRAAAFVRSADMESALEHLRSMHETLVAYGYGDRLLFDLGIFRNLEYYTGSVFELYAPGMGFTLGGGGRYDNLLARFGAPMPAVGLGLGLDRLHAALIDQAADLATGDQTVILVGGLDRHVAMADRLREACVGVFALADDTPAPSAAALARQKEIALIVAPVDGHEGLLWTVTDLGSGGVDLVATEELAARLIRGSADLEAPGQERAAAPGRGTSGDEATP